MLTCLSLSLFFFGFRLLPEPRGGTEQLHAMIRSVCSIRGKDLGAAILGGRSSHSQISGECDRRSLLRERCLTFIVFFFFGVLASNKVPPCFK